VAEMQPLAEQQGTKLSLKVDSESLVLEADAVQLTAAAKAIVQNALEAVKSGGSVELNVSREVRVQQSGAVPAPHFANPQSAIPNPQFLLSITDTGPGIPAESLPHLFDPYYSGREAGRGLGLGLSKAWRIVEQHGGRIEVENPPNGGARFTIVLPG
jgi:signal transduction histidine kinase